jgi:hypothetical protein
MTRCPIAQPIPPLELLELPALDDVLLDEELAAPPPPPPMPDDDELAPLALDEVDVDEEVEPAPAPLVGSPPTPSRPLPSPVLACAQAAKDATTPRAAHGRKRTKRT